MKNLKNTVAAAGLMAVLGFGAVSANAGLMVSDRPANASQPCAAPIRTLASGIMGILSALPMLDGVIISDRTGLMVSDRSNGCQSSTDGVIISDSTGVIISD